MGYGAPRVPFNPPAAQPAAPATPMKVAPVIEPVIMPEPVIEPVIMPEPAPIEIVVEDTTSETVEAEDPTDEGQVNIPTTFVKNRDGYDVNKYVKKRR